MIDRMRTRYPQMYAAIPIAHCLNACVFNKFSIHQPSLPYPPRLEEMSCALSEVHYNQYNSGSALLLLEKIDSLPLFIR